MGQTTSPSKQDAQNPQDQDGQVPPRERSRSKDKAAPEDAEKREKCVDAGNADEDGSAPPRTVEEERRARVSAAFNSEKPTNNDEEGAPPPTQDENKASPAPTKDNTKEDTSIAAGAEDTVVTNAEDKAEQAADDDSSFVSDTHDNV